MRTKELVAALIVALVTTATAAEDLQLVGQLGRPDRLAIEGAKAFSAEEIRQAVFDELDVVAACEPQAPLAALMEAIADKAAAGYRQAGFFNVDVSLIAAEDKLSMTIAEGERFTNGEIHVSGNRRVDAEKVKTDLIRPETTGLKPRPLWKIEHPASFGPENEARLASKALESINNQGFYRAMVEAKVVPDQGANRATLRIEISDEGRLSTLVDVAITGNERTSREALTAYLGVDPSAPLTRELCERIERRLLDSGRFVEARWELGKPEERDASWRPRLVLQEFELAPPLDQPVSREEAALLKLAEWFGALGASDEEIVQQSGNGAQTFVFAPRRGFIVSWKETDEDPAEDDGPEFNWAIVMNEERVGLYSASQRRKLVAVPPPSPITGRAILSIIGGPPKWGSQGEIELGAGLSTRTQKGYRRHMKVEVKLTAAAALSVLRKHKANCRWDEDVLTLEWEQCRLRASAITGQLIEYVIYESSPAKDHAVEIRSRLTVKPGEFDRKLGEIERAAADWPNVADPRRPLSCFGEFLCREMEQFNAYGQRHVGDDRDEFTDGDPADAEFEKKLREEIDASLRERYAKERYGYAVLAKTVSLGILKPFDELISQAVQGPEESFSIPAPFFELHARSLESLPSVAWELAPIFGVRAGNFLFPADSWMNAVWRQGLLAAAKKRTSFLMCMRCTVDDRIGPLNALAAAELLRLAGADFESKMYALSGRPSGPTFRDECRELASGEGFASKLLLNTAATMSQLDHADVEALTGLLVELDMLNEMQAAALEFAALRAREEDSPAEAATAALDALWRIGLSAWVERRLGELHDAPK